MYTLRSHLSRVLAGAVLLLVAAGQVHAAPIHIAADHAKVFQASGKSVYTGHVMIRRGPVTLRGHKLIVYRLETGEIRAKLLGNPAQLKREDKNGKPVTGHARRVVYNSAKKIVKLVGNAFLSQGGNTLSSDMIRHNLATGRTIAGGGKDARVRITLQPKSGEQSETDEAGSDATTDGTSNADHGA